jgi:hypothetical protein
MTKTNSKRCKFALTQTSYLIKITPGVPTSNQNFRKLSNGTFQILSGDAEAGADDGNIWPEAQTDIHREGKFRAQGRNNTRSETQKSVVK